MAASGSARPPARFDDEPQLEALAFEHSLVASCIGDPEGIVRRVNGAFVRLWGAATSEGCVGRLFAGFFADAHAAAAALASLREHGRWEGELRARRSDGATFLCASSATVLCDADGREVGFQATSLDVTERKATEKSVRRSEAVLSVVFNNNLDIQLLAEVGPAQELRVAAINQRYLDKTRAFGFTGSAEDLVGLTIEELNERVFALPREMRDAALSRYRHVAASGAPLHYEEDIESPEVHYYGEMSLLPVKDEAGVCRWVLFTAHDITERKRGEKALRESEERFAVFMDNLPAGAFMKAPSGDVVFSNRYLAEIFGWAPAAGRSPRDLIPAELAAKLDADGAALAHGPVTVTERLRDATGRERVFEVSQFALPRAGHPPLVGGIVVDMTERIRAEADRERLRGELAQVQKMESVGRLAGGVAHDFNNKLLVILGHADLALRSVAPRSELAEDLTMIRDAGRHAADLTRQLLAFARKQTVAPKALDFNATVAASLTLLRRLLGEDVSLVWSPAPQLDAVCMDPSQVDQILTNLCVNARDALQGVGTIAIETSSRILDAAYCSEHRDAVPGRYVVLSVTDTGSGMDDETLARLFEPFFTTKELGRGTGLGLSTVHGMVKQNGGHITVHSEIGHGTTMRVYLPCHTREGRATPGAAESPVARRGDETILLVEDDAAILRVTKTMLEVLGYAVIAARSPSEALRFAHEHQGGLHLVITDVVMPEMNGRDLAERVHSLFPEIQCLYMSGYTADVIAHRGVLEEGVHFVQKPFSLEDLSAKVREALDR